MSSDLLLARRIPSISLISILSLKDMYKHISCASTLNSCPTIHQAFLEIKEANNNSRNEEEGETNNLWIMKPVARSRGRGIKIVHDFGSVRYSEKVILQKYVHKPLLLNGYVNKCTYRVVLPCAIVWPSVVQYSHRPTIVHLHALRSC